MAVSAITGALISAADSKFHLAEQSLNASRDVVSTLFCAAARLAL
jgi:hypothetical protein